jgi:cell division protein FtsL
MSEQNFGKEFLRGESPIEFEKLTDRVIQRDRLRILALGAVCVVAWMAVVMLPWATILPMLAKVGQYQAQIGPTNSSPTADQHAQLIELAQAVKEGTIATFVSSIASMFVAALSTVALIVLSRRATMRQVNGRLVQISNQIKALSEPRK